MRRILFFTSATMFTAATMFAAAGTADAGTAAPLRHVPSVVDGPTIDVQYRDCHNFTRNHYVPEWDVTIPHHHNQYDCRPVRDHNDWGSSGNDPRYNNDRRARNRDRDGFGIYFDLD